MTENVGSISESFFPINDYLERDEPFDKITDAVTGKIFYCNGMTTSEDLALTHARTISALTGIDVELHYNNTTSFANALGITGKLALGSLAVISALLVQKRLLFVLGLASFAWGLFDLNTIDKEKNTSAQILANLVKTYLDAHPLHHITLIFHSQGADIGHRALEKLSAYKDLINVVTIGGVVDIPDHLALRVVNFMNDNDLIAYLAKTLFNPKSGNKTKVPIKDQKSPYLDSHYSIDYLERPQVKQAILDLVKSRRQANTFPK